MSNFKKEKGRIFVPFGRYIYVSTPLELEEEKDSKVLIPDGCVNKQDKYAVVEYRSSGPGCDGRGVNNYLIDLEKSFLIVERRFLEKIDFEDYEVYIIPEQYVVGAFSEELKLSELEDI